LITENGAPRSSGNRVTRGEAGIIAGIGAGFVSGGEEFSGNLFYNLVGVARAVISELAKFAQFTINRLPLIRGVTETSPRRRPGIARASVDRSFAGTLCRR